MVQLYFLKVQKIYGSEQRRDHAKYDSIYSKEAEDIRQSGMWDTASAGRPSYDSFAPGYHARNESQGSALRNEVVADGSQEDLIDKAEQTAYMYPQATESNYGGDTSRKHVDSLVASQGSAYDQPQGYSNTGFYQKSHPLDQGPRIASPIRSEAGGLHWNQQQQGYRT